MKNRLILLILIFSLTISLFSFNLSFSQNRNMFRRSIFQPGDAISIEVIEIELQAGRDANTFNINKDYSIARDGTIYMPLIGKLKVVGLDQEGLTALIAEKYSAYFSEPFITVTPLIRIVLMGAFNRPGSYRIDPEASLWDLIEMADGPGDGCDLNSISVVRGGEIVIDNLLMSFEQGHSLKEIGVRSGDQIKAKYISKITARQIMDYTRFGISLISLYFVMQRYK